MKRAYSQDIRELALKKLREGKSKCQIGRELNITPRTIYNWVKTAEENGRTKPIGYGERNKGKISPLRKIKPEEEAEFYTFVVKHRFKPKKQMIELWYAQTGRIISIRAIETFMRCNKITRKKKHLIIEKRILFCKSSF